MCVIHFGWFGEGWNKSPFFWIECSDVLEKEKEIINLFSIDIIPKETNLIKNLLLSKDKIPKKIFVFDPYNIVDFFKELKEEEKGRFLIANDTKFWGIFLRWCLTFLIRQEVIPYLIKNKDGFEARWLPVLKDASYRDLIRFVKSLPLYNVVSKEYDDSYAANMLLDICYVTVDALCRISAVEKGFSKDINPLQSIHDLWLYSLLNKEAKLRLEEDREPNSTIVPKDVDKFYSQIMSWQSPIVDKLAVPFKLVFKLITPKRDEDWKLKCLLQPIDDPSLMIPISLVWQNPKDPILVSRGLINPKITILAMLSRASKLFPPIKRQLLFPEEPVINLSTKEAYHLLKEAGWLLKEEGFCILIPNWWRSNTSIYKLHTKAIVDSNLSKDSNISLNAILDFRLHIAFEGEPLSEEELLCLASAQKGLMKLRDRWIEIDPDNIKHILEYIRSNKKEQISMSKMIAASLGYHVKVRDISIDEFELSNSLKKFIKNLKTIKDKGYSICPPKRLRGQLRGYQINGLGWLYFMTNLGLGVCLADDMGLGKTIQVLALIEKYFEQGIIGPFLIISPTSVIGNWEQEINRFLPHISFYTHQGMDRVSKEELRGIVRDTPIVITSYALLTRDFDRLKDINWVGVIADEAQNIKNPLSKQFRCAKGLKSSFRVALTGTPVENSLSDLWSIIEFLNPGLLGSYESFRRDFLIPIQLEDNKEELKRLKSIISPFILRREKTDPAIELDLPDKKEQNIEAFLTEEQASLYMTVVENVKNRLDITEGIAKKGLILSAITKLKQICDHPALFLKDDSKIENRSGKLEILKQILTDILNNGESSIIFTQFSSMGHILKRYLSELFNMDVLFIHGGLPRIRRDEIVEYFQTSNTPNILVLSLRASGTGLNLTKATHVFHYDRWWNPAVENQATDRAYRIGQAKEVRVYKFICKGTIEEKIEKIIENKIALAQDVVTAGETWITKLSDQEIKRLIMLDN